MQLVHVVGEGNDFAVELVGFLFGIDRIARPELLQEILAREVVLAVFRDGGRHQFFELLGLGVEFFALFNEEIVLGHGPSSGMGRATKCEDGRPASGTLTGRQMALS